jgi:hypothetical protein
MQHAIVSREEWLRPQGAVREGARHHPPAGRGTELLMGAFNWLDLTREAR